MAIPGTGPIALRLADITSSLTSALKSGKSVTGVIRTTPGGLEVLLGQSSVQLPESVPFKPGDTVHAKFSEGKEGPRLHLTLDTPGRAESRPGSGPASHARSPLGPVLQTVSNLAGTERTAAVVVRGNLPIKDSAVRLLMNLFFGRGAVGKDLAVLEALVRESHRAGVMPKERADQFLGRLVAFQPAPDTTETKGLKSIREAFRHSLEQRIASWLMRGGEGDVAEAVRRDLRALVSELRRDEALRAFMAKAGAHAEFNEAADRLLERVTASQLQNARASNIPYQFVELPLPPDSMIDSARLHFFTEKEHREGRRTNVSTVVLDLDTRHAGLLWATIRGAEGACSCHFQSSEHSVVNEINELAEDLETKLRESGYAQAEVRASLWNGDRVAQMAHLMARLDGLDLRV